MGGKVIQALRASKLAPSLTEAELRALAVRPPGVLRGRGDDPGRRWPGRAPVCAGQGRAAHDHHAVRRRAVQR